MVELAALIVLLSLFAFFSASETALMSLSKIRIRNLTEEKTKGAQLVSRLVENPSRLLGVILVGSNVVNISASTLAASLAIQLWGSKGVGIATGIMTLLVLIFGEVTPKSLAAQNPERTALGVAKTLYYMTVVLNPVITLLVKVTNGIVRIFGGRIDQEKPFITEEEFMTIVNVGHEEGVLETEEKQMIHNIVEFGDSQVRDIMTPRTDMVAIESGTDFQDIIEIIKDEGFSRIPVYTETTDNIIGILYVKDLFFLYDGKGSLNGDLEKLLRPPWFTYEFKRTSELFKEMRKERVPIAVVLDEYGGTAGLVTIEDLVEEIVGEIEDEYDEVEEDILAVKEDEYIVNGSARIELVNEEIGTCIESEYFDTIGGFVTGEMGRLPRAGETLECNGIRFVIQEVQRNRIKKLKIYT